MVEPETEVWRRKDGRAWRIGGDDEVAWITQGTTDGLAITSAIPPLFEVYATLELPGTPDGARGWSCDELDLEEQQDQDANVLAVLSEHTAPQPWWLGYLVTGIGAETIFYDVPKVTPYADWGYVLIEAGPEQAGHWRAYDLWKGILPDLMFPADRAWLVSTLWDERWRCIGGSSELIDAFQDHPDLRHRVRQVDLSVKDATPPGHTAT